ncbi:hypothetical protein [Paraglaciecola psychrophila]|uniref:hypothetical protein n=1 Tax=Paraglaciecola psychrophila TaxID=326544 RepID=UPI0002911656|nr:hypothetical protein [Paraglaciecola psychrophila]GAC35956.1 hypothetical protein GPSY_0314 [Paraglaciecola psychrophila 170]
MDLEQSLGGIVIQTQNGLFRSIGTFSTPMALAEFLAFCLVFCAINIKKPVIKNLFVLICLVSIYFTSYKTTWTYLPALLFFIYMPTKSHRIFTNIYSISLLVFGFLSTHTYFMYDFFLDISPAYAEYSIRLRIEFVERIFYQMTHFTQYFFGAGYGFNGGLLEYLPGSVPLDSLYIYLLSNYGLISIFTLTLFFIVTICRMKNLKYSVFNDGDLGLFIIKNYILIMLSANLFWNNPIVNYPSLFFPLVCYILLIKKRKHERRSLDYAT